MVQAAAVGAVQECGGRWGLWGRGRALRVSLGGTRGGGGTVTEACEVCGGAEPQGFLGTGGCGPEGCGGQLASLSLDGCGSSGAYDFLEGYRSMWF